MLPDRLKTKCYVCGKRDCVCGCDLGEPPEDPPDTPADTEGPTDEEWEEAYGEGQL